MQRVPEPLALEQVAEGTVRERLADLSRRKSAARVELAGALDLVEHRLGLHVLHHSRIVALETAER